MERDRSTVTSVPCGTCEGVGQVIVATAYLRRGSTQVETSQVVKECSSCHGDGWLRFASRRRGTG